MAKNTLIRTDKPHEVKLSGKSKVAQSPKVDAAAIDLPPNPTPQDRTPSEAAPAPKRVRVGKTAARPEKKAGATSAAKTQTPRAARSAAGKARPGAAQPGTARQRSSATSAKTAPPPATPRLPARVPADGLWEADSAIMQRLNALLERNARLSEQIQRLK